MMGLSGVERYKGQLRRFRLRRNDGDLVHLRLRRNYGDLVRLRLRRNDGGEAENGRSFRDRTSDSGTALIEMAVCLPLFLALVFGMFEYSIVMFTYCNATYACRNSARYASMHSTASLSPASAPQVKALVSSGLFLSSAITPTINVTYINPTTGVTTTNTIGNLVEVSASWSQTVKIPFGPSKSFTVGTVAYQMITR